MTNQCINERLVYVLTQNPDQWISVTELYNDFTDLDVKSFVVICESLDAKFNNIKKRYHNMICYLAFVTDNSILPEFTTIANENDHVEFYSDNECNILEDMINRNINIKNITMGNNTYLHVLFKNGRIDLVDRIMPNADINFDIVNCIGETLLDVMDFSNPNTDKLIRLLLNYKNNNIMRLENIHLRDFKNIRKNKKNIKKLKHTISNLKYQNDGIHVYKLMTFVGVISLLCNFIMISL